MEAPRFTPSRKQLGLLALAVGSLLAGKTIAFEGPHAAEMQQRATVLADALKGGKQDTLPAATVGEMNHLLASFDFGKFSRYLRRREPIWIGKPRPQNIAKQIANSDRRRRA